MSVHNTKITSDEYAMADTLVIDEGGIDLLLDGDSVMAASFEGLDRIRLMYDIMPEDEFGGHTKEQYAAHRATIAEDLKAATPEQIKEATEWAIETVYAAILNVAALKGWAK